MALKVHFIRRSTGFARNGFFGASSVSIPYSLEEEPIARAKRVQKSPKNKVFFPLSKPASIPKSCPIPGCSLANKQASAGRRHGRRRAEPEALRHRPCFGLYTDQLMHTEVPPGLLLLLLLVQANAAELFLKAYTWVNWVYHSMTCHIC